MILTLIKLYKSEVAKVNNKILYFLLNIPNVIYAVSFMHNYIIEIQVCIYKNVRSSFLF